MITESKKRDVALVIDDSPETLRLLTDALGRIPEVGDRIVHTPLALEVQSMDGYRVELVRVTRLRPPQPDEEVEPAADENEESPTE